MPILIWILFLGLPVAWLIAEFRGGKALRISLGLLAIVVLHFGLFGATQVVRGSPPRPLSQSQSQRQA
jgi:hypothetical protein